MMRQDEKLIDREQLLALVPYTIQHIYRKEKAGTFPKRVRVGPNRVAWVHSEIMAWINSRIEARKEAS